MSHHRWDFARLVRERGFRLTPQRQLVLDALCAAGGHTTAEAIHARVRARAGRVNRATVYRALDFLCQLRLVTAAQVGGCTVYELAGDPPHHHLVCSVCGHSLELSHASVASLFAALEREHGFVIETNHLVLGGVCPACARQEPAAGLCGPAPQAVAG